MEQEEIKHLLDKYWEGETSLAEEAELKAYFNRDQVPEALQPYRSLFVYQHQQKNLAPLDNRFERDLISKLEDPDVYRINRGRRFGHIWKAAAGLFVAAVLTAFLLSRFNRNETPALAENTVEIENAEEAYETARQALLLVSSQFNQGKVYAGEIKKIHRTETDIKQHIKQAL